MAETRKRTTTTTTKTKAKAEKIEKTDNFEKAEIVPDENVEEKKYTAEDISKVMQMPETQDLIQSMIAKALEEQKKQFVTAVPAHEENVALLYMGTVAADSVVHLNDDLGDIAGRAGTRYIPKRDFLQHLTPSVTKRLKDRRLIVLSGLTDEERERYGVKYEDGELLSPTIYQKLIGMNDDKIAEIFEKACRKHKEIITTIMIDAYQAGDRRVTQSLVQRLNNISKSTDPNGMFRAILKDMARELSDV